MNCPKCGASLPDAFGLSLCAGCGSPVFIDLMGNVQMAEPEKVGDAPQVHQNEAFSVEHGNLDEAQVAPIDFSSLSPEPNVGQADSFPTNNFGDSIEFKDIPTGQEFGTSHNERDVTPSINETLGGAFSAEDSTDLSTEKDSGSAEEPMDLSADSRIKESPIQSVFAHLDNQKALPDDPHHQQLNAEGLLQNDSSGLENFILTPQDGTTEFSAIGSASNIELSQVRVSPFANNDEVKEQKGAVLQPFAKNRAASVKETLGVSAASRGEGVVYAGTSRDNDSYGGLSFDVLVSEVDTEGEYLYIKQVLADSRLEISGPLSISSEGKLTIKNLNPAQALWILDKLGDKTFKVDWVQYDLGQDF